MMKKLYNYAAVILLFVAVGSLNAQSLTPRQVLPSNEISIDQVRARFQNQDRASVGEWLFFDSAYETFGLGTPAPVYANYLFPDSTILTNPSSPFPTWTHAIGQAYDLKSPVWLGTTIDNIDFTQPITIDSIFVWGFYDRSFVSTDTLRLKMYTPAPLPADNIFDVFYFAGATTLTNLGVDTAYFCNMDYTQATNTIDAPVYTHNIILDNTFFGDSTANGDHQHIVVPAGLTMTLNQDAFHKGVFGFTTEFRPGYSHIANVDIIGQDRNGYRPVAAELNGTGTFPTVTQVGDVTTGYILPIDVRYNNAGTWNGSMIPMLAYTAPYAWEYVYIVPYISQTNNASINPNESDVNFNIYPNPASDVVNMKVTSNFIADGIVRIYDLSGKMVKQFTNMHIENGNNTLTLDVSDLNNGAYITQLTSNGKQVNKNLIVAR